MEQSRREFLISCGTAALAAGVPGGVVSALAGDETQLLKKGMADLEALTQKTFEPLVKSTFTLVEESGAQHALELVEVSGREDNPALEQFSLFFAGAREPVLPQQIYRFEHPQTGAFELFIVPIGQDEKGTRYQAVINRLRDKSRVKGPAKE